MGPIEVVELLPGGQFLVEINVVSVSQKLVELLLVGPVRPLDLAIELWRPRLDVHMPDALVLDMPMELGLPLMPAISADRVDTEGELLDHVIDEVDRALLVVPMVNLQGANPRGIINGRVLIATNLSIIFCFQGQELHVYLDMMARDLFSIAAGVDRATPHIAWQRTYPIPFESAVNA